MASQSLLLDDGRQIDTSYTNGQRTTTTLTDTADAFAWDTIEDHFDFNGDLLQHVLTRDDGIEIDTRFAAGVRSSVTVTDGDDLHGWASYTTNYDGNGNATDRVLTMDDGSEYVTNYNVAEDWLG